MKRQRQEHISQPPIGQQRSANKPQPRATRSQAIARNGVGILSPSSSSSLSSSSPAMHNTEDRCGSLCSSAGYAPCIGGGGNSPAARPQHETRCFMFPSPGSALQMLHANTNRSLSVPYSAASSSAQQQATNNRKNGRGATTNLTEAEIKICEQLKSLTLKERDIIYEEVHGVGRIIDERPAFIEHKLKELQSALESIKDRGAYNKALFLSQSYVMHPQLLIWFLRTDLFDAELAAKRIVRHFEFKLNLFGLGCLARPVRWTDLHDVDRRMLSSGCFQMFPDCTDSTGRCLNVNIYKYRKNLIPNDQCLARCFWYTVMSCVQRIDDDAHRKGSVAIVYPIDTPRDDAQTELARESRNIVIDVIPMRITAAHFAFDDGLMKSMFSLLILAAPKEVYSRTKIHFGSHVECQYSMSSFGIQADTFRWIATAV